MKLFPVVGLAALMAAGLGSAALAQSYSDPDYQRSYQNYQDQQNVYENQRDAYAQSSDQYTAKRAAYERQRRAYMRARDLYDSQYGAGAYERYYGNDAYNPDGNYGNRLNDYRGDNDDGYDRGAADRDDDGRPY